MNTLTTRSARIIPADEADAFVQLAEFLRLNVAQGDASENTVRVYLSHIARFVAWCAENGIKPAHASEQDLALYRRELSVAGYKRSSVGVMLSSIRRFYEAAIWRGLRTDNPAAGLKPPREHTTRRDRIIERYLSEAEVDALLAAPDWSPGGIRDRAMIALMYFHGLRVSEVAGLHVENIIRGEHTQLAIRAAKGAKDRNVILIDVTRGLLDRWLVERAAVANAKSGEGVFLSLSNNHKGGPLTIIGIRSIINGYLDVVGLHRRGVSCHALRHAHATHALRRKADLHAVSAEMGHASLNTTSVYLHVVEAVDLNPAEVLRR